MNSATAVRNQPGTYSPEVQPALTSDGAAARFSSIARAMAALDCEMGHCIDPTAESCLLVLRTEYEVEYLETLYSWEFELNSLAAQL